ncbi:BLUF domain-containing protein [Aquamicrobium terrae]|uniref:BLUF domain-containing protein n=1 Tax=Aquamicrobium terrae TaxID=1324945 RepID=A0ABV2MTX4_9HYPH
MLIRLAYTSTFKPHITEADIGELTEKAADFNKRNHITGILAVEGERVCQILEGPKEAVEKLFESIQRDQRHFGVVELDVAPIDKPRFEAWGMVRRPMVDIVTLAFSL